MIILKSNTNKNNNFNTKDGDVARLFARLEDAESSLVQGGPGPFLMRVI